MTESAGVLRRKKKCLHCIVKTKLRKSTRNNVRRNKDSRPKYLFFYFLCSRGDVPCCQLCVPSYEMALTNWFKTLSSSLQPVCFRKYITEREFGIFHYFLRYVQNTACLSIVNRNLKWPPTCSNLLRSFTSTIFL